MGDIVLHRGQFGNAPTAKRKDGSVLAAFSIARFLQIRAGA
jgi:hypothetical protein